MSGIKILDMSRILAAPFASMLLGDLGADIVKVEIPTTGDDTRAWGPPFTDNGLMSAYFACVNRNKRSITVDFKKPEGQEIIRRLVMESDVLLENYVPGTLKKYGLDYEELGGINPRLIYCSITGYGPDGPYKDRIGVDVIVEAMAGLMHITGYPDGKPAKVGVAITDLCTGLYAHGAIMAALIARSKTNKGQKIDCSLLETQVSCLANIASNYLIANKEAQRMGTSHPSIVPYQTFETEDGHIMIGATNDNQWIKLTKIMMTIASEHPSLQETINALSDSKYKTNADRVRHRSILVPMLESLFKLKSTSSWLTILDDSGLSYAPINNIEQTFKDPQVIHRKMIEEVEHPAYGKIKLTGVPVKFSDTKATIRTPPPILGEHTDMVLKELGYSDSQIQQLRAQRVI
uniref:Formyl-CoA transferase n=1 Tax=Arcella intermedia TaxID=1963864 RepID=A0A6B2L5L6_9EUKA